MTIPYREWTIIDKANLKAYYASPPGTLTAIGDWTETHQKLTYIGDENSAGTHDTKWYAIFRPRAGQDFQSRDGMDEIMSIEFAIDVNLTQDTSNMTSFQLIHGITNNNNAWEKDRVNGKYYDGVNQWDAYGTRQHAAALDYETITISALPLTYSPWFVAYKAASGAWANAYQADFWRGGAHFRALNYNPDAPAAGEIFKVFLYPLYMRVRFFNPVVNSMDRMWAPTAGGVALVLTGLGFKNGNAEIDTNGNTNPGGWGDLVDNIYLEGLQGQGSTTLTRSSGDFTVDSNTQITIPSGKFPALSAGSYEIKLRKVMADVGPNVEGYAGAWRCDEDGRVREGEKFTIYISDTYEDREHREKKGWILLTDWHLKNKLGTEVLKYYSFDYVRCPGKVYKGNLARISAVPRGMDDRSGLFKVADLTLDLANNDLEFSKLLAGTTILKNQKVKIYMAYADEPEGWKSHVITMIIDDYSLDGENFQVKLKDITQKYFRKNIPHYLCTKEAYANIHPDKDGEPMPELIGLASFTTGENKGEVEAICVNTSTFKYLAARGSLKSIDQVYSDNVLKSTPVDYAVSYGDGGITYITFTGDQGDNKVTYNGKGYAYTGINSDDGYVRNPVYIALYFLLVIMKIPFSMIDFNSFEDLATKLENMSEDETGKLILQKSRDPEEILKDLLPGAKCYIAKDGRIAVGKKDVSNFATNNSDTAPVIFKQIDVLGKAQRVYNMRDAVNVINARFDWIPVWDLFKSTSVAESSSAIDRFEDRMEEREHEPLEV